MVGGDFAVNLDGLNHYRRFGYKGMSVDKTVCVYIVENEVLLYAVLFPL